ncbi:MAG TPA: formylmethanofuran dehydrogenase subunit A [Rhodocyclaceae bacterium]|nr:formylmethanofuran dehydrogenase subunit A [Rhodocyclaceae bacterium]HNA04307.1 formylmethanofuran dehydrogenase subunit A [Rhodocyclaceae bacterium]HNB78991.1 formylmethanofuran dehydrogenase subunit A [Rhodocyclaceae bacterium]HNC61131.1 formylmethanofuran dehydrogenase subunit A [Rhodocyclaceae bacterium]HNH13572.1 formylmethanofuran dehydrogenase subunit A [Rhodocyclaceae bacterium]
MGLIKFAGGKVFDPENGVDGLVQDIFVRDGRIVPAPLSGESISQEIDCRGRLVMAGAIDMHTHIGGGKVNIARSMLPEDHRGDLLARTELTRASCGYCAPGTLAAGYRYAEMGYTACFEPAVLPINARQAHMEMGDTPIVDKGGYVMLGSDDFLLRMMTAKQDQRAIDDYVAWTINAAQAIGIKVVNPGGISAFKFNQRSLDLDEQHPFYSVTPRQILKVLAQAVHDLGVPHPLHVHGCNLGVPGNVDTTLATIQAVEGLPMHLTHIQFHSYGTEGDRKFSSGAAQIAEAINANRNITADVGQIMFGQTVTASGDNMSQHRNSGLASPKKFVVMDIECDAGCGVVPFKYRDKNFVNALQWAIGLEIFLLVNDPWRIFLTTDHPNGAPFTSYPHLIKLLMDKTYRNAMLGTINADAAAMSTLGSIDREYTMYEIATMTRAAPARLLGLKDRGHLAPGAAADIVVYREQEDVEEMFARPEFVFKDGTLVARDGRIVEVTWGNTHVVRPEYDPAIEKQLKPYFDRYHSIRMENFKIHDDELCECGHGSKAMPHDCRYKRVR